MNIISIITLITNYQQQLITNIQRQLSSNMKQQIHTPRHYKWKPLTLQPQTLQSPTLSHVPTHKTLSHHQPLNSARSTLTNPSNCTYHSIHSKPPPPQTYQSLTHKHHNQSSQPKVRFKFADLESSKRMCQNHENKLAGYQATSSRGDMFAYCEKCTIMVASQGFQVRKLKESGYSSHLSTKNSSAKEYQQSSSQLYHDLQVLQKQILENKGRTEESIQWYEQRLDQELNKINRYFEEIATELSQIKNQYRTQLISKKQSLILNHIQWRQIFKDILEEIQGLKLNLSNRVRDFGFLRVNKEINQSMEEFKGINHSYQVPENREGLDAVFVEIKDIKEILRELLSKKEVVGQSLKRSVSTDKYLDLQKYLYWSRMSQERRSSVLEESILLDSY